MGRLSAGSNGFFRDSGNDTMYTSSGGSTDSSNRDQIHHRNQQAHPGRRHSEAKRISAPNLDNYSSASSTPKKSPYHRHLPSQATRVCNAYSFNTGISGFKELCKLQN